MEGNEDLYLPRWNYTNQDTPQMEMDGVRHRVIVFEKIGSFLKQIRGVCITI